MNFEKRSAPTSLELDNLLQRCKIIVCAGAGGAGKTTLAAAMAVRAARIGIRVACLTIDPARRLADSLGVDSDVSGELLREITETIGEPIEKGGRLFFGMLDSKETFDRFVLERAPDENVAAKILDNQLYRYISGTLSGMQEYMALEKLCEVRDEGVVDLIILDTPPTANAIDFFTAPSRVTEALDGTIIQALRRAHGEAGRFRLNMAGRWTGEVFRTMSKIIGSELLLEMTGFVNALSVLFGSFLERTEIVKRVLWADDVAICMVSIPQESTLKEVEDFRHRLKQLNLKTHLLIFNRCHYPRSAFPKEKIAKEARDEVWNLIDEWNTAFDLEQGIIRHVKEFWGDLEHVALVPILPAGATRIASLDRIGEHLINSSLSL